MGYFADIQKMAEDKRLLPGIGKREMATSKILDSDICDSNTGTPVGKAREVVTKGDDGTTVTSLVLPNGEITAQAREWETDRNGQKTVYANVVFNKKYKMEKSGKDGNEHYTTKKVLDEKGRVSVLEENDIKRTVKYRNNNTVEKMTEERPSLDGLFKKYGFRDSRSIEYDLRERPKKAESTRYSSSFARPGHVDVDQKRVEYIYGREGTPIKKEEEIYKAEIAYGRAAEKENSEDWQQDFWKKFDNDDMIPEGFRKINHMRTRMFFEGTRVVANSEEHAYHDCRSYEKRTSYHENGNIKYEGEKSFQEGYEKGRRARYSEKGKIKEEETTFDGPLEDGLDDMIGTESRKETTRYDQDGRKESKTILKKRGNVSIETELDRYGNKEKQTVTVEDPDNHRRHKITKEYADGEMTKKTVDSDGHGFGIGYTMLGEGKWDAASFSSKETEKIYGDDPIHGGQYLIGRTTTNVTYDDNGIAEGAMKTNYDRDGVMSSYVEHHRTKNGFIVTHGGEDGQIEKETYYSNGGEYKEERPLCETKHVSVFVLEGNSEISPQLHKTAVSKERDIPVAVAYDITKKSVTIISDPECGPSAIDIAKGLWGNTAVGDVFTAYSPEDMEITPIDMPDVIEAVETTIEPADTIKKIEELRGLRSYVAEELRECICEMQMQPLTQETR